MSAMTDDDMAVVASLNATRRPFDASSTVAEAFAEQVRRHPEAAAVEFDGPASATGVWPIEPSTWPRRLRAAGVGRGRSGRLRLDVPRARRRRGRRAGAGGTYVRSTLASPAARLASIVEDTDAVVVTVGRSPSSPNSSADP